MGKFCCNLSSVSHIVQPVPRWFELKLFMNQLVVAVQLGANIIGQQLWMGFFFARPCCKRGLFCEARTFCHSHRMWLSAVGYHRCIQRERMWSERKDVRRWWQLFSEEQADGFGIDNKQKKYEIKHIPPFNYTDKSTNNFPVFKRTRRGSNMFRVMLAVSLGPLCQTLWIHGTVSCICFPPPWDWANI